MLGKQKQGIRTGELTQQKLLVSRFGGQKIKVPCLQPSDSGFVAIFGIPFLLHHPDLCLHLHLVVSICACLCLNVPFNQDSSHIGRRYPVSEARDGSREEPPCIRGQGRCPRPGAMSEARGGSWKEQPHAQGVVAVPVQEGLKEPSHIEGQEGWQEEIPLIQGKEPL